MPITFTQEWCDLRLFLQLPDDSGQSRAQVMDLTFKHSPLAIWVREKMQHRGERERVVSLHVGESATLPVLAELLKQMVG